MSDSQKVNLGNFFLGVSLLVMFLGWFNGSKEAFSVGFVIGVLWVFGKLVAFIARSLGLK